MVVRDTTSPIRHAQRAHQRGDRTMPRHSYLTFVAMLRWSARPVPKAALRGRNLIDHDGP